MKCIAINQNVREEHIRMLLCSQQIFEVVNILFGGKWGGGGDFGTKYMLLVRTLIDYTRLIKKRVLRFDHTAKRPKGVSR